MPSVIYEDSPIEASQRQTAEAIASSGLVDKDQDVFERYSNAIVVPNRSSLWTSSGQPIQPSLMLRKHGTVTWPDSPAHLTGADRSAKVRQPLLWAGPMFKHYGHFLLESTSRLWAWLDPAIRTNHKLLMYINQDNTGTTNSFRDEFFDLIGISEQDIFTPTTTVKVDEVIVPYQTLYLEAECFRNHIHSTHMVARAAGCGNKAISKQSVFLSRSALTQSERGVAVNEHELEVELGSRGMQIVHPELLSLREQVELWNSCQDFVGVWGSAFHSVLFSLDARKQRTFLINRVLHSHYYAIDSITGVSANYLRCLHDIKDTRNSFNQHNQTIDIEFVIEHLRKQNVI